MGLRRTPFPGLPLLSVPLLAVPLLAGGCEPEPAPDPGPADHRRLWEEGRTFGAFLGAVEAREATWRAHAARAGVPGPLRARARAAAEPGWRLLVVADDWCGDSAHTVPWVARLADQVEELELRIVGSDVGRAVMRAHPTPDGRAATPTMVLLDGAFEELGCFVERPPALQRWFLDNPDGLSRAELLEAKYDRYEADAGRSTLEEIVAILEAAAGGDVRCGGVGPAEGA